MDTFLAESGRLDFSFRLLIATTDLIGRTAKRTIEAQEKQASVLLRGDLEAAEVDWPAYPSVRRSCQSACEAQQTAFISKIIRTANAKVTSFPRALV